MKNNHLNLTILSIIFGVCFYGQIPSSLCMGLFATIVLIWSVMVDSFPDTSTKRFYFVTAVVAALASVWYGNLLSFTGVFLSLCAYLTVRFSVKKDIFRISKRAVYLFSFGIGFILEDIFTDKKGETHNKKLFKNYIRISVITGISLLVALVFTQLYLLSNQKFEKLISEIDLSFISIQWFFVCVLGFVLLYGFIFPRSIHSKEFTSVFRIRLDSFISRDSIFLFGHILISILTLILFVFFVTEIQFLTDDVYELAPTTPGRYSEVVHDSVETLILSIILVICFALFIFRTRSISSRPRSLEILSIVWFVLNLAVVVTSAIKNWMYVTELGLTYKRLGVHFFLFFVTVGLIYLILKVRKRKSNHTTYGGILRIVYSSIIICCLVPWNYIIAQYNVSLAIKNNNNALLDYSIDLGSDSMVVFLKRWDEFQPLVSTNDEEKFQLMIRHEIIKVKSSDIRSSSLNDKLNARTLKRLLTEQTISY